jgi:hypothetical protein
LAEASACSAFHWLCVRSAGLPGLRLRSILAGVDVCLEVVDTRLDLLAGFPSGLVERAVQVRDPLLQRVHLIGNAHDFLLDPC